MSAQIPLLYKKILDKFDKPTVDLIDFKKGLAGLRISNGDNLNIAKELEKFGVAVLELNGNQYSKIRFSKKGLANLFLVSSVLLAYCIVYLLVFYSYIL
jgi:hypothetical protein